MHNRIDIRRHERRLRGRLAVAAAAITCVAVAAPAAHAGSVIEKTVSGPLGPVHTLQFGALSGEDNNLVVGAYSNNTIRFEDSIPITSYPSGCQLVPGEDKTKPGAVSCDATGIDAIRVLAGNGANLVRIAAPYPAYVSGTGAAHNEFHGGTSVDTLIGDGGSDLLDGNAGADRLEGGAGVDELLGDGGRDVLLGENGDDALDGGGDDDIMRGGLGTDRATYGTRTHGVKVSLDGIANDGTIATAETDNVESDVENITGSGGDDVLIGSLVINRLYAGKGDDTVYGGGGADDLYGEQGEDELSGGAGNDRIYGNPGNDVLDGGAGGDNLNGREDDDLLRGGAGSDFLEGGDGVDRVSYANSAKPVRADADGAKGDDGAADEQDGIMPDVEQIVGSPFDDTLAGNAAANVIWGGAGADRIAGGAGTDQLLGEAGNDTMLSADGVADSVDCGDGRDAADADPFDSLANCDADAAKGGGTPGTASRVRIGPARVRLTHRGVARLRVVCPAGATQGCRGTLRMRRKVDGRMRTIGSHRFAVAAGGRAVVPVRVARVVRVRMKDTGVRVRVSGRLIRILPARRA
jgi:Ca2+-binding RTX toxin-like protein